MKEKENRIYISHLLPDEEMKEVTEQTGAGIESIDFSISENLDRLSESISSYKKRLQFIGTRDLTIHGPFLDLNPMTFDKEIRKISMMRYAQSYEAARELGAKKIVFHTCLHPDAYLLIGWAERMADFFLEFLEDRKDIEVVMENVYDRVWEPIAETAGRIKYSNFHLCFDMGHAYCYSKQPIEEWTKELAPYISHVHVHDNFKDRDTHLALGCGNIPLDDIFAVLKEQNCTYTIECGNKEAVLTSYKTLQKLNIDM